MYKYSTYAVLRLFFSDYPTKNNFPANDQFIKNNLHRNPKSFVLAASKMFVHSKLLVVARL